MRYCLPFFITAVLLLSACRPSEAAAPSATPAPTNTPLPPSPTSTSTPEPTATPVRAVTLRRGVNLGDMLEAPEEGEWGAVVQEEYFDLIRGAGFDFVRLPVRWNSRAEPGPPYTIDPVFFARVDEVVRWALEHDLAIILDFHHYEEMMTDPQGHKDRFLGIWKQVAEHYRDYPPHVLFELLNEPNGRLDESLWNQYLAEALAVVRETNPRRDVVIGPASWNAHNWISTLELPDDAHLIVTFHYYLPFQFTHQGAEWVQGSQPWLGTTWNASEAEKAEITRDFDSVADWANRMGVRILLGEFGVYSTAEMDSRVRWTEFVRSEAERLGFAWAYWEFGSGFGIYDPEGKVWREELLKALIP